MADSSQVTDEKEGSSYFSDYAAEIAATDVLNRATSILVLQGLYGEVGGIMATVKNMFETNGLPRFQESGRRRIWRHLWYLAAICRRLNLPLDEIFGKRNHGNFECGRGYDAEGAMAYIAVPAVVPPASLVFVRGSQPQHC